jgi:hypothetical protein
LISDLQKGMQDLIQMRSPGENYDPNIQQFAFDSLNAIRQQH